MRSDTGLPAEEFRSSADWQFDAVQGEVRPEIDRRYSDGFIKTEEGRRWHSFSGHERNHFFANRQGTSFQDLSALSGIDNIADGRACALWDFNQDGLLDIALANANTPLLNFYQNQIPSSGDEANRFVAVRLVGGNRHAAPSERFSSRDAYGAAIRLEFADGAAVTRHLACGEGFAAQNTPTMVMGIGKSQDVRRLLVTWPSGRRSQASQIPAGRLVTVFEDPSESPSADGVVVGSYPSVGLAERKPEPRPVLKLSGAPPAEVPFRLLTAMATWCAACKKQLPQLGHLRATFKKGELGMFGIPVDTVETREQLRAYRLENKPAYQLLQDIGPADVEDVRKILKRLARTEAIPACLLLNIQDEVIAAFPSVPTVSEIRQAIFATAGNE